MTLARLTSRALWTAVAVLELLSRRDQLIAVAPAPARTVMAPGAAPAPRAPFATYTRELRGRVLDEHGIPVPSAIVVAQSRDSDGSASPTMPAITDRGGGYHTSVTALQSTFDDDGAEVTITADGFETTVDVDAGTTDTVHDFRLFRPLVLTAGTEVHLRLDARNARCGRDAEYRCRVLRIKAPQGAAVTLDTRSEDPWQPVMVTRRDALYDTPADTHVSATADGTDQIFLALVPWNAAATFVIRARVR